MLPAPDEGEAAVPRSNTAPARRTLQPSTLTRRTALIHSATHQGLYDGRTRRKIKAMQDDSDDEPTCGSSSVAIKPAMAPPGALLASYAADKSPATAVDVWQGGSSPRTAPSAPQTPSAAGSHDTSTPENLPAGSHRSDHFGIDIHTCSWVNVPNVVQKAIIGAHDKVSKMEEQFVSLHKEHDRFHQLMHKTQEWTVSQFEGSKQALREAVRGMKGSRRSRRKQLAKSFSKSKSFASGATSDASSPKASAEPSKEEIKRLSSKQRRTPVIDVDERKLSSLRVRTSGQQHQLNKFSSNNAAACSSDSSSDASSDELDELQCHQITKMQETLKTLQASMTTFTERWESDQVKVAVMESKLHEVASNLDQDAIETNIKDHVWQSIVECLPKWLNWMGATDSADLESARAFFKDARTGANKVREELSKEVHEAHEELLYRVEDLEREVQEFFVEEADDDEEDEEEDRPMGKIDSLPMHKAVTNRRATRFVARRNSADPGLETLKKQHMEVADSQASSLRASIEGMPEGMPLTGQADEEDLSEKIARWQRPQSAANQKQLDDLRALEAAHLTASAPDSSAGILPSEQENNKSEARQAKLSEHENNKPEQDEASSTPALSPEEKAQNIQEMKHRRRSVGAGNQDLNAESEASLMSVAQAVVSKTRQKVVPHVSVVCHKEDAPPELVVPPRSDEALSSPGGLSVSNTRNNQRSSGRSPSLRIASNFEDGRSRSHSPEGSRASSTRSFGRSESPGVRQRKGSRGKSLGGSHNDSGAESLLSSLASSLQSSPAGTPRGSLSRCSSRESTRFSTRFNTEDLDRPRSPSSSAQPRRSIVSQGNRAGRSTVKNKTVGFPIGSECNSRRGSTEGEGPGQSRARTKITHALVSMEDKHAHHEKLIKRLKDHTRHHGHLVRQHTRDVDALQTLMAAGFERIEEQLKESSADAAAARASLRQDLLNFEGRMASFKEELDSVKEELFNRLSAEIASHLDAELEKTVNQIEAECERINAQARIVFPRARKEDRASSFSASEARWYVLDSRLASCEEKLLELPVHQGSCMSLLPPDEVPRGRRKNPDKWKSNSSQSEQLAKGAAARLRKTICKEIIGKKKGSSRSALGGNNGKEEGNSRNSFADAILAAATITVPMLPQEQSKSRASSRRPSAAATQAEMQQDVSRSVTKGSNSDGEQEPQVRLESRQNSLEGSTSPECPGNNAGDSAVDARPAPAGGLAPLRMKLPTHELRDEAKSAAAEAAAEGATEVVPVSKATMAVDAAIAEAQKFLSNRRAELANESHKDEVAPSTHRGELSPGSRRLELELEGTPPPLSDVPIHSSGSTLPLVNGTTAGPLYHCTQDAEGSLLTGKEVVNAIEDGPSGPVLMKLRHQDESHSLAEGIPRKNPAATAAADAAAMRAAVRPHSAAARGMNARGVGVRQRPPVPRGAVQSGQKATGSNNPYEAMRISVELNPDWQDG